LACFFGAERHLIWNSQLVHIALWEQGMISIFRLFFRAISGPSRPRQGKRRDSLPTHRVQPPEKKPARSAAYLKQNLDELPQARVVHVCDGDSVIVEKGWSRVEIRLDSIDCPEDGQLWGDVAKWGLLKQIGGRWVRLEEHGVDPYGRTLATVFVQRKDTGEWINVNERMVMLGHAWVMRMYYDHLPQDRRDKLNALQNWAKIKKVGLWRHPNPIPPWTWRKGEEQ
jgi:endonuclease YncB( thermonuclease family)